MKRKGSDFERHVCKELSLWWSGGDRDDMFWRTAGSGARSTVRAKKGVVTFNQCGDVAATDPDSVLFIKAFAVELKRGYPRATPVDLLDHGKRKQPQVYDIWLWKVIKEAREAGRPGWMIIHRRDGKESMVWVELNAFRRVCLGAVLQDVCKFSVFVREPVAVKGRGKASRWRVGAGRELVAMAGLRLDDFLYEASPSAVREMMGGV